MIVRLLPKRNLKEFIDSLRAFGEVHGPVARGRSFVFAPIERAEDVVLDYQRTILPLRKYFYSPEEEILHFKSSEGFRLPPKEEIEKRRVIFGVHSCDITANEILDLVYADGFYDSFYFARRRATAIIGMSCTPDDLCFCSSMGADFAETGFDLFLTDIGKDYFVRVGTSLGDDMIRAKEKLFKEADHDHVNAFKERANRQLDLFTRHLDLTDLAPIIEMEFHSKVWEEVGQKCLGCGTCSMVCPTCYCHDIYDKLNLDGQSGVRIRRWSSCILTDFALVAGGHNFRAQRPSRVKVRYFHKQKAFVDKYGRPSCVGCGRCTESCPTATDIVQILARIRGEGIHAS